MTPDEYKYEGTKSFITDTASLDDFHVERYTVPAMTKEEFEEEVVGEKKGVAIPIRIFNFPWNEQFEGIELQIGKINIVETEDKQNAALTYEYRVLTNPNDLPFAQGDEDSRDNPDNELLDVFVGRVVESLLYRMSQDEEFLEKMGESVDD